MSICSINPLEYNGVWIGHQKRFMYTKLDLATSYSFSYLFSSHYISQKENNLTTSEQIEKLAGSKYCKMCYKEGEIMGYATQQHQNWPNPFFLHLQLSRSLTILWKGGCYGEDENILYLFNPEHKILIFQNVSNNIT